MEKTLSKNNRIGAFIALFLALAPILDPYKLFELESITLRIMELPMVLIACYILVSYKRIGLPNKHLFLILIVFTTLTLLSFFAPTYNRSFFLGIKVLLTWSVYAFCISYLWKVHLHEKFIKYATNIAIIATILSIAQFIAVSLGYNNFFDGKIPFLELSKNDQWTGLFDPNTFDVRINSFFQEPSYFGIYCLPVFAMAIIKQKFKIALFIFIGLVMSSSLIAVLGSVLVVLYLLIMLKTENKVLNFKLKFLSKILFVSSIAAIFVTILYHNNANIQSIIDYTLRRIMNIGTDLEGDRLGSTKLRLIGYAEHFYDYPIFFKIVGVGASQFPLYLSHYGVEPYSSTMVVLLLNYGLIGIVTFSIWLLVVFFKSKSDKKVFVIIFIIICFVDNFWFNFYFLYILTWFLPFMGSVRERVKINNKFWRGWSK